MGFLKEFKDFALRGNVLDMAIGVILGIAFGKIVNCLVNDVLMPPIGQLMGGVNFTDLFFALDNSKGEFATLAKAREAGVPVIAYGLFINTVLDFLIVAFCVFLVIKVMNTLKRRQSPAPAPAPTTKNCPYCCSAIAIRATRCPQCTSEVK
ncbi:MAG: Large-conductance mechanosensitive channel [Verrucomicrobiae bacterium]|nr:Large-conductance mechanosensitive channel [Verrucomicrobiae bacterium]